MPNKNEIIMIQIDDVERPATPAEIAEIKLIQEGSAPTAANE